MLTAQQIKWAAQHDWFVCDNGDGTITVRDTYMVMGGGPARQDTLIWEDRSFAELRSWAGY